MAGVGEEHVAARGAGFKGYGFAAEVGEGVGK